MSDYIDRTYADIESEEDPQVKLALQRALSGPVQQASSEDDIWTGQGAAYWHVRALAFEQLYRGTPRV